MADFNYSLWESEDELPARSRLYCLKMEAADGYRQEALLDYCQRLAMAHRVPVKELLKSEIIPLTEIRGALSTSRFSTEYAKTFNGYGKYAVQVTHALQILTQQTTLAYGTFIHWKPVLDSKGSGLLHPIRRWCPSCLAEARDGGWPIIHALIWAASVITHCAIHLTPLRHCCEACGATQPFISDNLAYGRCANCGTFLGTREGLWSGGELTERQNFFVNSVAEMITIGAYASELAQPEKFSKRLTEVVETNFGGSIGRLEKDIGFRTHSISKWVRMETHPQFNLLMELCYRLAISPVKLLSGDLADAARVGKMRNFDVPVSKVRQRPVETLVKAVKNDVDHIVTSAIEYTDAISFSKKFGMTVGYFKYWFPEEYKEITSYRQRMRAIRSRLRLERILAQTRETVRNLFAVDMRVSRRRIDLALQSVGISIRDPEVRAVAREEHKRLLLQITDGGHLTHR